MAEINAEIAAYEAMREELESKYMGKWVLVYDSQLVSVHGSFDDAAQEAVRRFKSGPYLIRQVGAPPVSLPASVMYRMNPHA